MRASAATLVVFMKLVSFDALRTLNLPDTTYIKPELFYRELPLIRSVDWVLFPQYWQLNALLFAFGARIFPSHAAYLLGHDKVEMTRVFAAIAPQHIPETLIEANDADGAARAWERMVVPFVAKLPRASQGTGVFLIRARADWLRYLARTPVIYVQEYLPIDRDLRIVVVGRNVIGGYWRLQSAQGFHNNVARGGLVNRSPVPRPARELVLRLARTLGIDHAGFDVAMVVGHPYVLEFNRLFGNSGLQGGADRVSRAMLDYLRRGTLRDGPGKPSRPRTRLPLAV
jgi:ribosomal protein S6--L-glutamate ligase